MRMPLFTWNSLCAMVLIISAFPVLTAVTLLLWLDRSFRHAFLYDRIWRKSNDVLESHMDVGASGGLYFGYSCLWHVLGNCLYFFPKKTLPDMCPWCGQAMITDSSLLLGLASSLFCHGSRP